MRCRRWSIHFSFSKLVQSPGGGMADTLVLEASAVRRAGSSPVPGTNSQKKLVQIQIVFLRPKSAGLRRRGFLASSRQSERVCAAEKQFGFELIFSEIWYLGQNMDL